MRQELRGQQWKSTHLTAQIPEDHARFAVDFKFADCTTTQVAGGEARIRTVQANGWRDAHAAWRSRSAMHFW